MEASVVQQYDGTPGPASGFDPRFDPKFQPGYDARSDPAEAARITGRLAAARGLPEPGVVVSSAPRAGTASAEGPAEVEGPSDADAEGALERDAPSGGAGRNPFVVALWIVSVAFAVAGTAVLQAYRDLNDRAQLGDAGPIDYALLQLLGTGAPGLFQLSLVTVVGLLFFHAVAWRRRNAS